MIDIQNLAYAHKPFTISLASWLLHFFDNQSLWPKEVRDSLIQAVEQACQEFHHKQQNPQPITTFRKDPRLEQIQQLPPRPDRVKIYTDYEVLLKDVTLKSNNIELVTNEEEADFIFTTRQMKDFLKMPLHQRICQFPYESALIRKDLLPLTVRQYCCDSQGKLPSWWLPYYDLSTEFHLFAEEHQRRTKEGLSNRWILKPAQGTRGMGHRIVEDSSDEGLHYSAIFAPPINDTAVTMLAGVQSFEDVEKVIGATPMNYDGMDRVAQLLVDQPLLMRDRKFDMRCYVLVRSFEPFEAYFHELFYSRLAYKPYSNDLLHDPKVSITVNAYDEIEEIANNQGRVHQLHIQEELDKQYGEGVFDWAEICQKTTELLRELFRGASKSIGQWPNSSAYYSVDIIYDLNGEELDQNDHSSSDGNTKKRQAYPRLIEVNFMGDWTGAEGAVKEDLETYYQWATDVLTILALPEDQLPLSRLTKL